MTASPYVVRRGFRDVLSKTKRPLLRRLDIELTERCNNNCIHCYINQPADDPAVKGRELDSGEIKAILSESASLGCLKVRFTGGEPLLREDFEELYLYARQQGLKVVLFTNATLITPRLADLLARIPPLQRIEVSLYGMERRSYEAVSRVSGSYEAAWRGLHLLLERGVPLVVKGALLPPNKGEIQAFENWASAVSGVGGPSKLALFLDLRGRRDSEKKNRLIRRLRLPPQEAVKVLARRPEVYLEDMRRFCAQFVRPMGDALFTCGSGRRRGCVDAYGSLQPCLLLRHPATVYGLRSGSLEGALTDFFPQVREIRATDAGYLRRCARCALKNLCEQCPAKSWMEHGTLDTPVEYLCEVTHAQAVYMGLLEEGERAWEVGDWSERIARFSAVRTQSP